MKKISVIDRDRNGQGEIEREQKVWSWRKSGKEGRKRAKQRVGRRNTSRKRKSERQRQEEINTGEMAAKEGKRSQITKANTV